MSDAKDFDALQREWYQRLKDDGFVDIENSKGELKAHGSQKDLERLRDWNTEGIRIVSDYYSRAGEFLNVHAFTSLADRAVWRLHSEGIGYHKIAARLGISYSAVLRTVHRLRVVAGLGGINMKRNKKRKQTDE
jgi:uncharacterized protein YerC